MADSIRGRFLWYELMTTDMEAASQFYATVVGWQVQPFQGAGQPYNMFMRAGDVPAAGVMDIPEGMNFPPHWAMYLGVDTLEDGVIEVERRGGKTLSDIINVPEIGRLRTMYDPQGAMFNLYEPAQPPLPEEEPQVGEASWHELNTTDSAAALQFYTEMFGWQPTSNMEMDGMGTYRMFGRGQQWDLGGIMDKPLDMAAMPPSWNIYYRVTDLDAALARAKSNGGTIIYGPMEVPGGDRVASCTDPQGALFSLHERAAAQ